MPQGGRAPLAARPAASAAAQRAIGATSGLRATHDRLGWPLAGHSPLLRAPPQRRGLAHRSAHRAQQLRTAQSILQLLAALLQLQAALPQCRRRARKAADDVSARRTWGHAHGADEVVRRCHEVAIGLPGGSDSCYSASSRYRLTRGHQPVSKLQQRQLWDLPEQLGPDAASHRKLRENPQPSLRVVALGSQGHAEAVDADRHGGRSARSQL
mmetsp:Transcript_58346/g.187420  ORF Transcript_58346/g.187420 Transcript_58346/m.187420 type:complete len:212 (-) Transcript_58346:349-984(-)